MSTITLREFCERIYCGFCQQDAFEVDPATGDITFEVQIVSAHRESRHRVQFTSVHELTRNIPAGAAANQPGDKIELSVIELEREPRGWRVWFNPWYLSEIEFHCGAIHLDGAEVTGTGGWLQDDLPKVAI